ncbi:hypothetical protein GCM10010129_77910 [Streptomyces fumigatiscleroticus]|nr:hypothetical protein GCM10010129_77910 [Streptomyces fumigatiscleroticus]
MGIATLYRRFPTRTSLVAAGCAEDASRTLPTSLHRFIRAVAEDPGPREVFGAESLCLLPCRQALCEVASGPLEQAGAAPAASPPGGRRGDPPHPRVPRRVRPT